MEQPVVSGTAHGPEGERFAFVGLSNAPTDWARVLTALAGTDLTLGAPPAGTTAAPPTAGAATRMTPPSVLDLHAYLLTAIGKAARRRLTDRLAARGLRLWHLTVMALLGDLGPQMKTALAARLDMNASDLVKIVNDLDRAGHVDCVRDLSDRRRVVVRLTDEGRTALAELNADIASADDDILAPLSPAERDQLGSLLRRVHRHLEPAPAAVVHESPSSTRHRGRGADVPVQTHSVENGRIDWSLPAESLIRFVDARRNSYPTAYTHHNGRRLEILAATVTRRTYAGTPGLVLHTEDEGVVIVTGPAAHTGHNRALALLRVRTEEGRETAPEECFGPAVPAPAPVADRRTLSGG
ncbi:winged helix DNA-binding protein [Streptomyces exfoliatus]|uniref:winged helix DNA-binding protein n=1 Tax=Streptomyces exfoliatus TaxID=1905 RepID=UPI0004ADC1F1|nr:winged helix DNA-binding protein [Streptomyces exfoliatus]